MKILFTGASSFTGMWFASALAEAGHELVLPLRSQPGNYEGVRRDRVDAVATSGELVPGCAFGDERFMALISESPRWDLLCHHGAEVTDYKSPDFDVAAALHSNTLNLPRVLELLAAQGCRRILLTGTVFENGEGAGSDGLPAFSPYGLSKAFTAQAFAYHTRAAGMHLGKFVIPNPFGPWEEPRFTAYLVRNWLEGKTPSVRTPEYVRDNIHVSLLALAYRHFAESLTPTSGFSRINPSGYIESQGEFANRLAAEMRHRLNRDCKVELQEQVEFDEPRNRTNTDPIDAESLGWNEATAWDGFARYYLETLAVGTPAPRS
jgi:nucleoside-diphosphate-sugar epimerase